MSWTKWTVIGSLLKSPNLYQFEIYVIFQSICHCVPKNQFFLYASQHGSVLQQ